jgi:hypothetical protein
MGTDPGSIFVAVIIVALVSTGFFAALATVAKMISLVLKNMSVIMGALVTLVVLVCTLYIGKGITGFQGEVNNTNASIGIVEPAVDKRPQKQEPKEPRRQKPKKNAKKQTSEGEPRRTGFDYLLHEVLDIAGNKLNGQSSGQGK